MKYLQLLLAVIVCQYAYSQTDSLQIEAVKYTTDYQFKEGILLDFNQLKTNSPIPKSRIITNLDYNAHDFFDKLLENEKIYLYDLFGMQQEIEVAKIWGFCRNGVVYINWNREFNRLPVIGNLNHFIANTTIEQPSYMYDGYYSQYRRPGISPTTKSVEMRQFILDFDTGIVYDYNYETVEALIMKDTELYDEFVNLRKKKKKQQKFIFIRKFNERNSLFLPK